MNKENLLEQLSDNQDFVSRHNGSDSSQISEMLVQLGVDHLETLITQTIPDDIRLPEELDLPKSLSEAQMLAELKQMAKQNQVKTSFIGQGYYNTYTPAPILRNVLENPGWYTAYTPYQPEISQGRLESLLNFQQMIIDLTGMTISNASLLDEATAAAEAMTLCFRNTKKKNAPFFVANDLHPQSIRVLETRAKFLGIELVIEEPNHFYETTAFGAIFQYPNTYGVVADMSALVKHAQQEKILTVFATDLLALTLLKPPGEFGADVVIGSAQRFGVPMGFGGPHAAFIATTDKLKRSLPGRVIGVSIDANGAPALRMAMQTREQHIRREKATSNICTAQALLANISAFYAIYHGPDGLKKIARRVHHFTRITAEILTQSGLLVTATNYFDTLTLDTGSQTQDLFEKAQAAGFNLRLLPNHLALSFDETTTLAQIQSIIHVLTGSEFDLTAISDRVALDEFSALPVVLRRQTPYLTHPVFHQYQSETLLMRYMKHLENKDFSLTHGMIPLGSCTMKLNAAAEMIPVTWEEFSGIHPFAPASQTQGYQAMISQLNQMLCTITGYDAISMQPNSGAQGEYAGLIAIQRYHQSRGQGHRNICLIPSSAHGTNPASAAMVSLSVVVVQCDKDGNIDINDLKSKIETHHENLSCMMITYPSTHGVFEANIRAVCDYVHQAGGQVYLDGANMNAQVGLTSPGFIGADVSHLNLHKTFCIPHGGGGPGMGPIGVKQHLAEFLPNHFESSDPFTVSAAPFGSASILPISWAYIRMMGSDGLTQATRLAILHANYMMQRLSPHYPILYRGENGRIAHECIIDIREIKEKIGITEEDIAKRLMDYGFHAPTMSFPVAGTLMIEPTESEDRDELDRFCDAMINIKKEINQVASGVWSLEDNPLVNAPHTQEDLMQEDWSHPYTRQLACYPAKNQQQHKYWPTVKRVNNVHGDRQLICSCPPPISDI